MLSWVKRAQEMGATHIILAYDKEDKEQYPVFIKPEEDLENELKKLKLSEGKQEIVDVVKV